MGNASFQERLQHAVESSQYEHVTQRKDPLLAARREGRSLATKDFRSKGRRPDPPVPAEPVTMYEWPVGFTVEQNQPYTLHRPRHFLPGVAAARSENGTCRCEIGRWSLSAAQLPTLQPEVNMVLQHRVRAVDLPDLYVKNHALERPFKVDHPDTSDGGFAKFVCLVRPRKLAIFRGPEETLPVQEKGRRTRRLIQIPIQNIKENFVLGQRVRDGHRVKIQ